MDRTAVAVSCIAWLGVTRRKTGRTWKAKLLHRWAQDTSECPYACAASQLRLAPSPRARSRRARPPTQRRCRRQSGSPYHNASSLAGRVVARRVERRLSRQARPSQCRREQQIQTVARTERVRLCDAERRLARTCANCPGGTGATVRITGRLHQGVRCRSHLTRHKISDRWRG